MQSVKEFNHLLNSLLVDHWKDAACEHDQIISATFELYTKIYGQDAGVRQSQQDLTQH